MSKNNSLENIQNQDPQQAERDFMSFYKDYHANLKPVAGESVLSGDVSVKDAGAVL